MKTRILLSLFAAAGMLLAASCTNDELTASIESEGGVTVSFSLGLEGGVQTRAISDATGVDMLVYAIYDSEGNPVTAISGAESTGKVTVSKAFSEGLTETVTVDLVKDQTYSAIFWAQDADCEAYTVGTDTDGYLKVTVDYTSAANNDETRDAFYGTIEKFTVSGSSTETVTLKRPFAQVNVGVTQEDWTAATGLGTTITQSSVTFSDVANVINLKDGSVSQDNFEGEVTYALNTIPADQKTGTEGAEESLSVNGTEYKWLSMSYILVNNTTDATASSTTAASFTFKDETTGDVVSLSGGLESLPVQRNYRTNIVGRFLTGSVSLNVEFDTDFAGSDYTYPSNSEEELLMAAANGGSVTLEEDVVLDDVLVIEEGVSATIDLNNYSITYSEEATTTSLTKADSDVDYIILVKGSLTINGDGVVGSEKKSTTSNISVESTGALVINGGTYYFNPTDYVDSSNYQVMKNNGSVTSYRVVGNDVFVVTNDNATTLQDAIADGAQIILGDDIDLTSVLYIPAYDIEAGDYVSTAADVTIDLNGNSIISSKTNVFQIGPNGTLTINGDGTIGDSNSTRSIYSSGGTLTINGGTYAKPVYSNEGSVTVTDGTFDGDFNAYGTTTDITGGTFNSLSIEYSEATISDITCNSSLSVNDGTVSLSGVTCNGTFTNFFGTIEITDCTFERKITCESSSTTINSGTFAGELSCSDSKLTINGGEFSSDLVLTSNNTVTISNGTFAGELKCDSSGTITITGGTFEDTIYCCDDVKIVIEGGTFTGGLYSGYSTGGGTIKISGGTFKDTCTLTCYEGDTELSIPAGTITITGGTFYNAPTDFLESGSTDPQAPASGGTVG